MVRVDWLNLAPRLFDSEQQERFGLDNGYFLIVTAIRAIAGHIGWAGLRAIANLKYMRLSTCTFPNFLGEANGHALRDQIGVPTSPYMILERGDSESRKLSWTHYLLLTKVQSSSTPVALLYEIDSQEWLVFRTERQVIACSRADWRSRDRVRPSALATKGRRFSTPEGDQ